LENVIDGSYAFYNNSDLESFEGNLSKLENGEEMFMHCDSIITFFYDLPSLMEGYRMFNDCDNLTSFISNSSSMTNGYQMFEGCDKLVSFSSNLGSLKSGYQMFEDCELDAASVQNIANTINDITDLDENNNADWTYEVLGETKTISSSQRGRIDIGHDESISEDVIIECGNKLYEKCWDAYFNGVKYKYQGNKSPYDVSEANGWCPNAYKSADDNWNTKIYKGKNLIITKITSNGEMLNDE
jgi:hypothetical protein